MPRFSFIAIALLAGTPFASTDLGIIYRATFPTGSAFEQSRDIAIDTDGNAYVLCSHAGNPAEFVLAKLSLSGEVLYTSTVGGSGLDVPGGLALDANNDVYIAGRTLSDDFPTVNAMQSAKLGPSDAFLVKLDGQTGAILMSTYLGGVRAEGAMDVAIAPDQSIVIVGYTDSIDFPTVDPIQDALTLTDCFCDDMFVTRLAPDGQSITFSTYLGGSFTDQGQHVGVDALGKIYVAGRTQSPNFPVAMPEQASYGGGDDVTLTCIDPANGWLEYSTYLGGNEVERVYDLTVMPDGRAYLCGSTESINFPTTLGAFQPSFVGAINGCGSPPFVPIHNCADGFITAIAPDGGYMFSTFLAGEREDYPQAIAIAADGRVRVSGYTISAHFPGDDLSSFQYRAILCELTPDGSALSSTTIIETNTPHAGRGLAIGADGTTYFGASVGIPTGPNTIQYDVLVEALDTRDTTCSPDFNADGELDFFDVQQFLDALAATDPAADFTGDGVFDFFDIQEFLEAFSRGCG